MAEGVKVSAFRLNRLADALQLAKQSSGLGSGIGREGRVQFSRTVPQSHIRPGAHERARDARMVLARWQIGVMEGIGAVGLEPGRVPADRRPDIFARVGPEVTKSGLLCV